MLKTQLLYTANMTIIFDDTLEYKIGYADLDKAIDMTKLYFSSYEFGEAMIIDNVTGEILVHMYRE